MDKVARYRVLSVDPVRKRVLLTAKRTLIKEENPAMRFEDMSMNQIILGCVERVEIFGVKIRFFGNLQGLVHRSQMEPNKHSDDQFAAGTLIRCRVCGFDSERKNLKLSLNLDSHTAVPKQQENVGKEEESKKRIKGKKVKWDKRLRVRGGKNLRKLKVEDIHEGDTYPGIVFSHYKDSGIFVRIENSEKISVFCHRTELSDDKSVTIESFEIGDRVKGKILRVKDGKFSMGLKPSYFENEPDKDEEDFAISEEEEESKTVKDSKTKDVVMEEETNNEENIVHEPKSKKNSSLKNIKSLERFSSLFGLQSKTEDVSPSTVSTAETNDESNSSNDEDNLRDDSQIPVPKVSMKEKIKKKILEESKLRETEISNIKGDWKHNPTSETDFERLLITDGDSSIVWIKYMAHLLKISELDRAREVAERGVKHISFTLDEERCNVWMAYLNLEMAYGDETKFDNLLKRVLQYNEKKKIYVRLCSMHERLGQLSKAKAAHGKCSALFPRSKKVAVNRLTFLYSQKDGTLDEARQVLRELMSGSMLTEKKKLFITAKAGQLEYKYGNPDIGQTILEGLLTKCPRRVDIWSIYLDCHIKAYTPPVQEKANLEKIRSVFEKALTIGLKPRKMKFFFKRWLDFEQNHGDADGENNVQNKAKEYIASI
eukprot:GHVL01019065.1.p1 GENE.GHVL01019065.1~~GHVL01019065.1.p1  ORF type:complete len:656 (-),score=126.92 GHVL01019065.1:712-2679(-)